MSQTPSEDVLGQKIDRCLADSFIKTFTGFAIGTLASVAIFKMKRTWPITMGTGIGIGMGWSNTKHELQKPYRLEGKKVRIAEASGKPSYQIVVQERCQ